MEVLDHNDLILIPDHTYNIYGVEKLLKLFCKKNKLNYYIYSLNSLKHSIKNSQLEKELIGLKNKNILLFIVPVSISINEKLYHLWENKIHSFATPSTGIDHVNKEFLKKYQIPFFDAQGENRDSVVEYVLSLLPYIIKEDKLLKRDVYFGIIGYGRIGSLLSKILKSLGFNYIAIDPYVMPESYQSNLFNLKYCDVITFHLPLTYEGDYPTYHIMEKLYLNFLQKQHIIINTSRGKIFSPDSYKLFCQRNITAFDVFYIEPPTKDLLNYENLKIATPHIAGYNWISRFRSVFKVLQKFSQYYGYEFPFELKDFQPPFYEIEIFDSIFNETQKLKKNPSFFSIRDKYPIRASIKEQKYNKNWNAFHKLLFEFFRDFIFNDFYNELTNHHNDF
jgi:phosphoglycerate dehydrogenase-like enzyme